MRAQDASLFFLLRERGVREASGMCVPGGAGQSFGVMTDFGAAEVGEGFSSAEPLACRVQLSAWEGGSRKRGVGGREKVGTSVFAGGTARVH